MSILLEQNLIPLITIPVIYFFVAFIKPYIQPKLPFNVCAVCASVSATWIILLVLWLIGESVSLISLGILMGMSVAGFMYKMEAAYKKRSIRNFWFVRLAIVISGFYFVFNLLEKKFDWVLMIAVLFVILVSLATFLFQGTTHDDVVKEQEKSGKDSSIIKKLDNCC
ncbi:hypothetical protein A3B60_02495 [Candidatus Peregrinibacteria bacterium RIFCSPLOWO2_01_FULL_39_12]|nr:MAG: hypothetical protein A3I58_01440 [Candidatus Peregrinibacteria bacterium RIFCSPLOWO2_02_FULL_39_10]OGJ42625.1 MAG: hypothetical protein A3B60_02495 [Candidatus Peregrinibacteria bacterium RIFCSPLOWO2_01_FULL_39_12]